MKQNQLELEKEKYIHSNYHETLIFERYVCQKKLMTALELGDAKQAYDILQTLWADIRTVNALYSPERENFRVLHNQLVSMNTFCLLCAIKSAPNPLYLHAISRHYDTMIEKATSKEDADILLKNMLEDYCSFSNYTEHGKYSDVVQKAIWHVTANPESKLNLENLAHVLEISPAGLSRKFHAETGQTLSQYHIAFRIRMARRYLQEGGYSITQVAHLTGFTDASYFSKVFAKHMGESPSAAQTLGVSEAFNLNVTENYVAGDYLYYFGGIDGVWLGLWGTFRVVRQSFGHRYMGIYRKIWECLR